MGKRILKIIICQLALIFYWAWLYKVEDLIESQALMNLINLLIIGIIYAFIHTEISKSEDKKSHGFLILISFLFFALALNKNLSPIIFIGLGLPTSLFYIK